MSIPNDESGFYGSQNNLIRDLGGTTGPSGQHPIQERFKVDDDKSLHYRNDLKGVSKSAQGGHLAAGKIFDDIQER